jgi:tetratricopeptide (TPR) repeat protein
MALYKLGKNDAAKQALQKALKLNPQFSGAEEAKHILAGL